MSTKSSYYEKTVVLVKSIGVQLPRRQEMEMWKWVAPGTGLCLKPEMKPQVCTLWSLSGYVTHWELIIQSLSLVHIPCRLAASGSWVLSFHWIGASLTMAFCRKGIGLSEKLYLLKFLNNKSLAVYDSHCFAIDFRRWSMTHCGKDRSSLSGTPCQKLASPLVTVGVPL